MDDAEEREDLKFDFLTKCYEHEVKDRKNDWTVESPMVDNPMNYALNSSESVYDDSY